MSKTPNSKKDISPPATTIDSRERQLIALASDLAEKQLRDGSASSQVITHYLKLGTTRAELEKQQLEAATKLAVAKAGAIEADRATQELYSQVLVAMKKYSGKGDVDDEEL